PAVAQWIHTNADPKLDRIQQEIQRRKQTSPAAAEVLARDLKRVRAVLSREDAQAPAADAPAEMHVVGMYSPKHWRKNEGVQVQACARPIVLVLCAYEPV